MPIWDIKETANKETLTQHVDLSLKLTCSLREKITSSRWSTASSSIICPRGFMQNIINNYATLFWYFQILQNCSKICQDHANSPKIWTIYANFASNPRKLLKMCQQFLKIMQNCAYKHGDRITLTTPQQHPFPWVWLALHKTWMWQLF